MPWWKTKRQMLEEIDAKLDLILLEIRRGRGELTAAEEEEFLNQLKVRLEKLKVIGGTK